MVNTVKIFNPREYPFGKLSINNRDELFIDNKFYPSVSNYIYSNLLRTPLFKQVIQNIKISDLEKEFNNLKQEEISTIVKKAIEDGLDAKIDANKDMQEVLLATKNEPIEYISSNEITGTGDDSNGLNMVGKYLEQKRRQIEISFKEQYTEKKTQEWEHALYEAYIADVALNRAIKNGNDLSEYMGKTPTQVIDMVGRAEVVSISPPKNFIIEDLYKKQQYKNIIPKEIILAVDNPESLVYAIRKKQLGQLRKRQLNLRTETILYMYCEYVLEKNYPELPKEKYDQAIKQQYLKYGWEGNDVPVKHSKLDLAKKVYDLYEKGMFSERLSTNMDDALAAIKVPTENEVIQAEIYTIPESKKEETNNLPYQKPSGKTVSIYETVDENEDKFKPFSLLDFSKLIKIGTLGFIYPTIIHYMYVCLLANLPGINNIKKAYDYIVADSKVPLVAGRFESPETVKRRYLNEKTMVSDAEKTELAKKGLNVKFSNRAMQNLLLDTKNDALIWNSYDPVLGIGRKDQGGMNIVGKYMMEIRTAITEERKTEKFDKLKDEDINNLLERDSLVRTWLEMRVKDMCKAIITVKNYKYYKTQENVKIDAEFATYVLDNIYQPCADLFAATSEIKLPTPKWFKNIVYSCPGFSVKEKDKEKDKEKGKRKGKGKPGNIKISEDMIRIAEEMAMEQDKKSLDDEKISDVFGVSVGETDKEKGGGGGKGFRRPGVRRKKYPEKDEDQPARVVNEKANAEAVAQFLAQSKERIEEKRRQKEAEIKAQKEAELLKAQEKEEEEIRDLEDWVIDFMGKKSSFPIKEDVIDVLWKRVAVMIYYLLEQLKETTIQNVRRVLLGIEKLTSKLKPCEKIISGDLDNCIVSAIINILQNLILFNKKYSIQKDVEKIDIETAISIILNKDMKGTLDLIPIIPKNDTEEGEEEEEEDEEEEDEEDEEEEDEDNYGQEDEDEEIENEGDYGDDLDDDEFGTISSFPTSNQKNNLIEKLSDIPEVGEDVNEIYQYIISAIEMVKTQKIPKHIKINRINFFATQK